MKKATKEEYKRFLDWLFVNDYIKYYKVEEPYNISSAVDFYIAEVDE